MQFNNKIAEKELKIDLRLRINCFLIYKRVLVYKSGNNYLIYCHAHQINTNCNGKRSIAIQSFGFLLLLQLIAI
jgi:hypothetical protein